MDEQAHRGNWHSVPDTTKKHNNHTEIKTHRSDRAHNGFGFVYVQQRLPAFLYIRVHCAQAFDVKINMFEIRC